LGDPNYNIKLHIHIQKEYIVPYREATKLMDVAMGFTKEAIKESMVFREVKKKLEKEIRKCKNIFFEIFF